MNVKKQQRPLYNYEGKSGRKNKGKYVHTENNVGVVMDTIKCELSFVLDCVNLGVAYEGTPIGKPPVPCVVLQCKDDSDEIIPSEVKEAVVSFRNIKLNHQRNDHE